MIKFSKIRNEDNEQVFFKETLNEKDVIYYKIVILNYININTFININYVKMLISDIRRKLNLLEQDYLDIKERKERYERESFLNNNQIAQNFEITRNELEGLKKKFEEQFTKLKNKCNNYKQLYKRAESENIDYFNKIKELEKLIDDKDREIIAQINQISLNKEQLKHYMSKNDHVS